ncbi:MAG: [protein-PII] uridylyltransferase [Burkholderiales bacterium]
MTSEASVWRETLRQKREGIQARSRKDSDPFKTLTELSDAVDELLRSIWSDTGHARTACLIAVGGYGRGLLYPYSDVDVLILLPDDTDDATNERIERLVSVLWDVGLEIGHSVRTIGQCQEEAGQDITVQTTLLESRLIAGSKRTYERFRKAIRSSLELEDFVEGKLLEQQQRHARFNDTAQNLEPNLKESPGGLRDLQNILWISGAAGLGTNWTELTQQRILTQVEARQLRRNERALAKLRIRLHYLAGRREDRLLFDYQSALASEYGFKNTPAKRASEQLMQEFFTTAKSVTLLNTIILQNLRSRIFPKDAGKPTILDEHFQIRGEMIETRGPGIFQRHPSAILDVFLLWQIHPAVKGLSVGTMRALWHARSLIDANFRRSSKNRKKFMEILRQPTGITHTLRRMNQFDVLGRYLPEFGRIVGQMQHDLFHVYTVDEHILMVVRNLRRFAVPEMAHEYPLCSRLISEFDKPELLYIAGLYHDIAKGRGGDHSLLGMEDAERFCKRHGIDEADGKLVSWLVEKHLYMSAVAQKHDLSDPAVIATFAQEVQNDRNLVALYLLTVADIRGTSPKVWNAWKAKLLEELFMATRRYISHGAVSSDRLLASKHERVLARLRAYAIPDDSHEAFWKQLDDSYFLRHDEQEIVWHTRTLNYRSESPIPIVKARLSPVGEGLQVMIYAPDENLMFARICGFFEKTDFDIVEAKIYTTRHNYVLDTFQVMTTARMDVHYRDMIRYVEHVLPESLKQPDMPAPVKGRVSRQLKNFPISPSVNIRADDRARFYYLNIVAGDRPGLLYRIALVLAKYHVSIYNAKINTLGERAEDTLLVQGEVLKDARAVVRLESELVRELQPGN